MDLAEIKAIPSTPTHAVDRAGNVYSIIFRNNRCEFRREKPKLMATYTNKKGYIRTTIKGRPTFVHRLVLETFVGPCPNGCEGSHIDGNRKNNSVSNLVWESRKDNHARKVEHGTHHRGERCPTSKLTEDQVKNIRAGHAKGKTRRELAKLYGAGYKNVCDIVSRRRWNYV